MNLIGHGILDYIVVFGFILYALFAAFTKTERILNILPAALSFFFFIEVGPRLTPDKLIPAVFLFAVFIRKGWSYFNRSGSQLYTWALAFFFVLLFSTFIGAFYNSYFSDRVSSPHLSTRLFIQVVSYTNALFIFLIVRVECARKEARDKLLKSIVSTTTILTIYGFYQYIANAYGLPFRGIVYSAGEVGTASVKTIDELIFRVNSFANEPKRLTYFIVLGALILIKFKSFYYQKMGAITTWLLIAGHFVILWWTYSTSIYFIMSIFLGGLLIYSIFVNYNQRMISTLVLVAIVGVAGYFYQKQAIDELYEVRVVEQLEYEEVRQEFYGWDYIKKFPGKTIIGHGPGIYNFALADEFPGKGGISYNGLFLKPLNSALMVYLFDLGLIGFIIMIVPFILLVRSSNALNRYAVLLFFLYCTCVALDPTPTLFLILGAFDTEKIPLFS